MDEYDTLHRYHCTVQVDIGGQVIDIAIPFDSDQHIDPKATVFAPVIDRSLLATPDSSASAAHLVAGSASVFLQNHGATVRLAAAEMLVETALRQSDTDWDHRTGAV